MRIWLFGFFIFSLLRVCCQENVTNSIKEEWYRAKLSDKGVSLERKAGYLDSLVALEGEDDPLMLYMEKANVLYSLGRYREGLELQRRIQPLIPKDSVRMRFHSKWQEGLFAFTVSDYLTAVEAGYTLLGEKKPSSLKYYDFYGCTLLVDFYTLAGEMDLARKYIHVGLEVLRTSPLSGWFTEKERRRFECIFLRLSAQLYLREGKFEQAYEKLREARLKMPDDVSRMSNYILYAEISAKKGERDMAADYYNKALDVKTDNFQKACAVVGYMKLLLDMEQPDSAMAVMHLYDKDVTKIAGSPLEREHLENMAEYYSQKGEYGLQAEALKQLIAINDSIYKSATLIGVKGIAERYEDGNTQRELAQLESTGRIKSWLIASLAALLLLSVAAIVWMVRKSLRRKREFAEAERRIDRLGTEYDEWMRDSKTSLESRNQQLSSMTMYMARLNEALTSIQEAADDKGSGEEARIERIKSIVGALKREENVWEMFRVYFEQVNQTFFDRLFRLCPTLTKAETRMCAFILINLTTKETAILTNRSVRTVETIKHNLRKKLAITEPSEVYMRHLSTATPEELLILQARIAANTAPKHP